MRLLIHDYAGHPFQVQLSRELARRGHITTHAFAGGLLTPRGNLQKSVHDPKLFDIVEIPMDRHYRRDKYRFLRRRRMEVEYGSQVASLISRLRPDVVLSANTPTEPQWRIAQACAKAAIAFVPWMQDFYSLAVAKLAAKKSPVIGNVVGSWYHLLEARALRQAAAVVAITDDFTPLLQRAGVPPEKIVVIPNWAPLNELPVKPRRNAWSAAHGLDEKFVFLYAGTLALKHDPRLLRALAVSFQHDPEARIVVVSEGPGADYLRERQAAEKLNNLELLAFQGFAQMPEMLATAEVLLAVLEAEAGVFSAPSKVLTYHCAGKPILAAIPSRNLSARIITEAQSGTSVDSSDLNGFLEAAHRYRLDPVLRGKHGVAARAYAESQFDINKIADRFEQLLEKAVHM
jgi:colanic acid biosynthesis glycosyl transferase WcaI